MSADLMQGSLFQNGYGKLEEQTMTSYLIEKKRSEDSEFVIDVLIDSSGSQAGRQAQVAAQGYIISEALSQARIPHRMTGYCAFWGYTVLQRFRDYEDPSETNERIFQFRAYANNRDGLALKNSLFLSHGSTGKK